MKKDTQAASLFVLASMLVIGIAWGTQASLPISREAGKSLGMGVFLLGMVLFTWAVTCLQEGFLGKVAPASNRLVTTGPYRWVRHPLYLSMIVALLGLALAFRSLWGIAGVLALFVPAVVYRARLEEQALGTQFGEDWHAYARRTAFLLPMLW